jgi:hypothetical protein
MRLWLCLISVLYSLNTTAQPAQQADDSENDFVIDLMVVAKATGMCGALTQLVNFQESTKMSGGDEFVFRFLSTEAARLGYTTEQFLAICPPSVERYNSVMEMLTTIE